MNEKRKLVSSVFALSCLLFALAPISNADSWTYTRNGGGATNAYYDSSVTSYGYGPHFDASRTVWGNISSNVSIGKVTSSGGFTDIYYVGTSNNAGVYGFTNTLKRNFLGSQFQDPTAGNWDWCQVSLYDNNLRADGVSGYHTGPHELGHSLGLAHTTDSTKYSASIMSDGNHANYSLIAPTLYDKDQLRIKWGN